MLMKENNPPQKEKRLQFLATTIEAHKGRLLSKEVRQAIDNEQMKLEFRLKELVKQFHENELDEKIKAMEIVLSILKNAQDL